MVSARLGEVVQIDAVPNNMVVHVGQTFNATDVEKLRDAFLAFGPLSTLDIDFAEARQCDDSALARLGRALMSFDSGVVRLRGLTLHQWRLLTYMELDAGPMSGGPMER